MDNCVFVSEDTSGSRNVSRNQDSHSCVSLASARSKDQPPKFKQDPHDERYPVERNTTKCEESDGKLDCVFERLNEDVLTFFKKQLKSFQRALVSDDPECLESEEEEEQSVREAALFITVYLLKKMKQEPLAESLLTRFHVKLYRFRLKRRLHQKFCSVNEGVAKSGDSILLNQMYTELYITEGGAAEVNQEHEVRHIETASRKPATPESSIKCENIFKDPVQRQGPFRTVMSKGIAGIGKTILTRKFSLDWAEGRANQDIQLLFPFTFRELNVLQKSKFSLVGLLHHFFSESKKLCSFEQLQVLFIFDGLDECRPCLDFSRSPVVTDPTEAVSVDVLLVNLIRGSLLPSARLWITTRPAAANQIPAEYVSMVTEVRGFEDPQKEQYFKNRFKDNKQATAVISHIKRSRILHTMCRIPVFCWILSTVLQHVMKTMADQLPHTLTQMYIHFLVVQTKRKGLKYDGRSEIDPPWTPDSREMVLSLGKLAFDQLQKGNLIFYESDLSKCGLDAATASVYSGVLTQVFREEPGLYQDKVYCFIHLSVQEFLAALHIHQTFTSSRVNLLSTQHSSESPDPEDVFYRSAVDQTLQSPNGHLDLFLRFLLGLSLPTNQSRLNGLLNQTENSSQANQNAANYIKIKLEESLSAERRMNLLHCLIELNDTSLAKDIQWYMRKGQLSRQMSLPEWSCLAFILLSSNSDLEEFDLRIYCPSETAFKGLLLVIKASKKALLQDCNLSPSSPLATVLGSSSLIHLDLSNNDLQDSGVEELCSGLRSATCRLQTLRLSGCLVSERGGAALASALGGGSCHLRELDLSYNHPGPSAVILTSLQDDPRCPLDSLRLDPAGERWMVPGLRKYFCELALEPVTANRKLQLLNLKQVRHEESEESSPEHRDRFDSCPQVLCSSGLTGSCYWEVDWSGVMVYIAVCYKTISRKEDQGECCFGHNEWSWNMRISDGRYSFRHKWLKSGAEFLCSHSSPRSSSQAAKYSGRVGVFLDYVGGSLSFYEVLPNRETVHLHTFSSTFTEPLFPGFGLWSGSSVSLVDKPT